MALRLLEATVRHDDVAGVRDLLADAAIVELWTAALDDGRGLIKILIDAEQTETVSDLLVRHCGSSGGFRLLSMPVEATVPAVEADVKPEVEDEAAIEPKGAGRVSREELYEDVAHASRLTLVYVVTVALSTVVAAVGLIRGDIPILIGAMVIAPLLGPNVALSLAATLGHVELARRSLRAIVVGVATAAALSLLLGMLLDVDPTLPELAARTQADVADVVLALAAGAAGALAFTTGVPAVVVGVMVAVALLPPLVTAGLLGGAGHGRAAFGAAVLVLTNVTCVNLAAVATFLLQKVRPRTWWDVERARRSTRLAVTTWVVMLVVLLGLILLGQVEPV